MSEKSFDENTQPIIVDANEDLMICQVCYHRIEGHGNCPCVLANEGGQEPSEKDGGCPTRRLCCFTEKQNSTPGDSPWEGDGRAVAPCFCRGTLGFAHQRCVFRAIRGWSVERCENCGFKYEDKITKLPISQWKPRSTHPHDFGIMLVLAFMMVISVALLGLASYYVFGQPEEAPVNIYCAAGFVICAGVIACTGYLLAERTLAVRAANIVRTVREPIRETIILHLANALQQQDSYTAPEKEVLYLY